MAEKVSNKGRGIKFLFPFLVGLKISPYIRVIRVILNFFNLNSKVLGLQKKFLRLTLISLIFSIGGDLNEC